MQGINVRKIIIEKEENEKLYKALDILHEFRNTFDATIDEVGLISVGALNELSNDINCTIESLGEFLDELGYCDYIEIKG